MMCLNQRIGEWPIVSNGRTTYNRSRPFGEFAKFGFGTYAEHNMIVYSSVPKNFYEHVQYVADDSDDIGLPSGPPRILDFPGDPLPENARLSMTAKKFDVFLTLYYARNRDIASFAAAYAALTTTTNSLELTGNMNKYQYHVDSRTKVSDDVTHEAFNAEGSSAMWEYIMNEKQNKPVRDFINGINIEENSSVGVDFHDGDEYMDDNLYHVMAGMPKTCYSKYTPKIMAYN